MKLFRILMGDVRDGQAPRVSARRAPACEALEGRQLLNGNWGSTVGWSGPANSAGGTPPAQVHHGTSGEAGAFHHGQHLGGNFTSNPQIQADFQALQPDMKALRAEVPADLAAKMTADKAIIQQAFASITPAQHHAEHNGPHTGMPGNTDPTAALTARLTAANVPADQIKTIVADFQAYKTTMANLDPALHTKIAADRAALAKDMPASHHFDATTSGGSNHAGSGF